jgi:hypothetical protein
MSGDELPMTLDLGSHSVKIGVIDAKVTDTLAPSYRYRSVFAVRSECADASRLEELREEDIVAGMLDDDLLPFFLRIRFPSLSIF